MADDNIEDFHASVAVFFKLNLPIPIQQGILQKSGYKLTHTVPKEAAPGVIIGPPTMHIADDEETKTTIEYVDDRYLLRIVSPLKDLHKQNKIIASSFKKGEYSFSDIVRYCEFYFSSPSLDAPELIKKIKSINIGELSSPSLIGKQLRPYSISVSDPSNPLTDEWTYVSFIPDANCAENKIAIRVTKRTKTHNDMLNFLESIGGRIEEMIK